jgi:hypothetical protein
VIVKVAGIGIENPRLAAQGIHDPGMTVTHMRHIVVGVEISPAPFIVKILHPAPNEFDRFAVSD